MVDHKIKDSPYLLPFRYLDEFWIQLAIVLGAAMDTTLSLVIALRSNWITAETASNLLLSIATVTPLAVALLLALESTAPRRGMRARDRLNALLHFLRFVLMHRTHWRSVRFASEPLLPGRAHPIDALHALCFTCDIDERYSSLPTSRDRRHS